MYSVITTNKFEKELKLAKKRGKDLSKIKTIMQMLASGKSLPEKNKDHALVGNYSLRRECHIEPNKHNI